VLAMGAAWQLRLRSVRRRFNLVLAERMRVGREIHDTLLQSLVGVALEFDDISEQLDPSQKALRTQVQRIREHVERYVREARHSIWNLRSPMLETNDLSAAFKNIEQMAPFPFRKSTAIAFLLALALPMIPVITTNIPLKAIMKGLFDAIH